MIRELRDGAAEFLAPHKLAVLVVFKSNLRHSLEPGGLGKLVSHRLDRHRRIGHHNEVAAIVVLEGCPAAVLVDRCRDDLKFLRVFECLRDAPEFGRGTRTRQLRDLEEVSAVTRIAIILCVGPPYCTPTP
jgi:hypothetical protein